MFMYVHVHVHVGVMNTAVLTWTHLSSSPCRASVFCGETIHRQIQHILRIPSCCLPWQTVPAQNCHQLCCARCCVPPAKHSVLLGGSAR